MNHPKGCGNGKRRVTAVLLESRTDSNSGEPAPAARQTAPVDAVEWARATVTATGPGEAVSAEPWDTVWRLPVADGTVFVKECLGRWSFEGVLTAAVAAR